jgi:uncharacterized protein YkwD
VRGLLVLVLASCTPPIASPPIATPAEVDSPHYPLTAATRPEQHLFNAINDTRRAAGVAPLVWNEHVSLIARVSSGRIRDAPGEAPLHAADYGDLTLTDISENVARASTVDDAQLAWMSDARQRANLLSPHVTQIGVGVVEATDGSLCATAIVFGVTQVSDTRTIAARIASVLTVEHGPRVDAELATVAQEFATKLAAGARTDDVWPAMQSELSRVDRKYVNFRYSVTKLAALDQLPGDHIVEKLMNGQAADDAGVGVAQSPHPEIGNGALWVVVVYAEEMPFNTSGNRGR